MNIEEELKILAIHSQSNRQGSPLDFEGDPGEQAYDSRALCLPNLGVLITSSAFEPAYLEYYTSLLMQPLPKLVVPEQTGKGLSYSVIADQIALEAIRDSQNRSNVPYILSVFDPTEKEEQLSACLKGKGLNLIDEVNYPVAIDLGNKSGFRRFCQKYQIPQLPGGVFENTTDLLNFMRILKDQFEHVIVKHPNGTAGEGMMVVSNGRSNDPGVAVELGRWIGNAGSVVAEAFHLNGGEHALHIYIDPVTKQARVVGLYDQLVSKKEDGSFAHYGCKYPMEQKDIEQALVSIASGSIIPALNEVGYTGPACFDVLSTPFHFMELNARAGANMYVHRMVEKVAKVVYQAEDPASYSFMFLAGIKTQFTSFQDLQSHLPALTEPNEKGVVLFTNPARHKFGSFDITAMSRGSSEQASDLLYEGLARIIGLEETKNAFDKIYQR